MEVDVEYVQPSDQQRSCGGCAGMWTIATRQDGDKTSDGAINDSWRQLGVTNRNIVIPRVSKSFVLYVLSTEAEVDCPS